MENKSMKKSRRPYRRYTASIGDILHGKANAGDEKAKMAFEKLVNSRDNQPRK